MSRLETIHNMKKKSFYSSADLLHGSLQMVLAHKRNYKLAVLVDEHDLKLKIEETKSPLLDHTQLIRPRQPSSGLLSRQEPQSTLEKCRRPGRRAIHGCP
jgi:hypothetical protein